MQLELHRIAPVRAANVLALLYAFSMVLFAVPAFALFSVLPEPPSSDPQQHKLALSTFRWFLLAYPVLGLAFGWAAGLVGANVYNFIAPRVGGLRLEFLTTQQTS